jgi:hypothetical protein
VPPGQEVLPASSISWPMLCGVLKTDGLQYVDQIVSWSTKRGGAQRFEMGIAQLLQLLLNSRIFMQFRQYHSIHPQSALALARVSSSLQDPPVARSWPVPLLTLLLSRGMFAQLCTRWLRGPSVRRAGPLFMLPLQSPPRRLLGRKSERLDAQNVVALVHICTGYLTRTICPRREGGSYEELRDFRSNTCPYIL